MNQHHLNRFIEAQKGSYATALSEIKAGRKRTHWMWYIFPQLEGLGLSSTSKYYGIKSLEEATAYEKHEVLGMRLKEMCLALLALHTSDAHQVFGSPDDMKLKSSMTLFSQTISNNAIYDQVLKKFFNGTKDDKTLQLLSNA